MLHADLPPVRNFNIDVTVLTLIYNIIYKFIIRLLLVPFTSLITFTLDKRFYGRLLAIYISTIYCFRMSARLN